MWYYIYKIYVIIQSNSSQGAVGIDDNENHHHNCIKPRIVSDLPTNGITQIVAGMDFSFALQKNISEEKIPK